MLNCVIVDDQQAAIDIIKDHLQQIPEITLLKTFDDSIAALKFLENNKVEVVFLDVQMPHMNGIEIIEVLKEKYQNDLPAFILTTGHAQYAVSSYEYRVTDYLLKPIFFKRFKKAVEKVIENYNKKKRFIVIGSDGSRILINLDEIVYIKSDKNYVSIFTTTSGERKIYNKPLHYLQELLNPQEFFRVHKSYIVSTNFIVSLSSSNILLKANGKDTEIPIGYTYKKTVAELFKVNSPK
jgi:DNA-binding LytR/AlgR family response regulator